MSEIEKPGAFYLGREEAEDGDADAKAKAPLLYDAKDLTTHGLILGMTGSGKSGLGVVLLEEASIDGIPALVIDPKGDMANLALRFPAMRGSDFRPWIDEAEATRAGKSPDVLAVETAARWKRGIQDWGQSPRRIAELDRTAEVTVFTPGSSAGRGLALLKAFRAPDRTVIDDADGLRERVLGAVSGLLSLVRVDADPVTSREHILLSTLLERAWREESDLDLESIIRLVQDPPFKTLGVMELESVFPAKERFGFAMQLNNLLASPAFEAWRKGDPLDVQRLLFTPEGRPRQSVFSIAHLSDEERMFFVTLLLGEVVSWMRGSEGTGSLRAILYMDEIFGFFPPVKSPPSKAPMLSLLKQARAHGLGVVLATQNPVDLDYKGLGNIGTWFLGRLQTARDKERLLDGLTSAATAEAARDRSELTRRLSSLTKRQFVMSNVHEDRPVLFRTRWALSYLPGPLTREQIARLSQERDEAPRSASEPEKRKRSPATGAKRAGRGASEIPVSRPQPATPKPLLPPGIDECHLRIVAPPAPSGSELDVVYRPAVMAVVDLHFANARYKVDHWSPLVWLTAFGEPSTELNWDEGEPLPSPSRVLAAAPRSGASYTELPDGASDPKRYRAWESKLVRYLYKERSLTLWRSRDLKQLSEPEEKEGDFRARLSHRLREHRDEQIEKLRHRFAPKLARLSERIRKAESRVEKEAAQYGSQKLQSVISIGASLAGALFGRKLASATNVRRAATAARSASRVSKEKQDIAEAKRELKARKAELADLSRELEEKTKDLQARIDPRELEIEPLSIRLRKADTAVQRLALAWTPWVRADDGRLTAAYPEAAAGEEEAERESGA